MEKIKDQAGKILVTGAGGLNGKAIIREFERREIPVTAMVRDLTKLPERHSPVIDYLEADLRRPDTYAEALEGVARALLISTADLQMVETQCAFIDACKAAGVPHVIKFSGEESGIGFDPQKFPFTRMHEEIEDYLEASGLQWTHLRPSQFMEVYLREANSIKNDGVLALALEDITMSPVAVDDIAKIAVALLSKGGHHHESLRITGPQALSMTEIAEIISRVTEKKVHYLKIPLEARLKGMLASGAPEYFVDAVAQQTRERVKHPIARVDLSTHERFGVTPTYFEEFVQYHAPAFGKAN
jgi:uncharacterized protein YbjT (DUF2867 family)